jgi:GNAT superfamily N-acetyltransferase
VPGWATRRNLVAVALAPDLPIRVLGPADLDACVALAMDREWGPERHKWSLLLEAAEPYGIDAPDGSLAGAVVLARYGPALASVGMMLVASKYGRQGLGRRLMRHLLDQADDATVFLTATRHGRPLYEKLGFRVTGRSATFLGRFKPDGAPSATAGLTRPARENDLAALGRIDRPAFGADREYLLRRLFGFTNQLRVLERDDQVVGYAGVWLNDGTDVIGPVIAPDAEGAQTLITSVASRAGGPVRLDFDPERPGLARWARSHGLPIVNETAFMVHGALWPPPGPHDHLFCPITVALG